MAGLKPFSVMRNIFVTEIQCKHFGKTQMKQELNEKTVAKIATETVHLFKTKVKLYSCEITPSSSIATFSIVRWIKWKRTNLPAVSSRSVLSEKQAIPLTQILYIRYL